MERLRAAWGGLDVVVANAGLSRAHAVVETSLEEWRSVMAVNLDGVFLAAKHGLPLMGAGGAMVVVSSASGLKDCRKNL